MDDCLTIIGGGLAGAEAAWQAAQRGINVKLIEMRPQKMTPAHQTGALAELVCSNSFRASALENAVGLLKEEMRRLDSLIITCADRHRVSAGGALAVDRDAFAQAVTEALATHPLVDIICQEVTALPDCAPLVIASGPLTSEALAAAVQQLTGTDYLYFYDAVAPIVTAESLDYQRIFKASRYGKGEAAYLNCPFTTSEYRRFYEELLAAERHPLRAFEKARYFEGCMPVETIASRGLETLCYGPLKPVGLIDPRTGKQPYAVMQLRPENREESLYNMVGFQTNLKWGEQARVFRLIPGLEQAEFVRYGVMHRNTFINGPRILSLTLQHREQGSIFFAGQITGVEGYVESAATGLVTGINGARLIKGEPLLVFPPETVIGSLCHYVARSPASDFQPMNANMGLLPGLSSKVKSRRERNLSIAERALSSLASFIASRQV